MSLDRLDHVKRGLDRIAHQFKGKPKLEGLLRALLSECNAVEDVFQQLRLLRSLDSATGATLTHIGKLVGEPRSTVDDDLYRRLIKGRIQANRSRATAGSIYATFRALFPDGRALRVEQEGDAQFVIRVAGPFDLPLAPVLRLLGRTKGAGIRGVLEYSQASEANTFRFNSGPGFGVGHLADAVES